LPATIKKLGSYSGARNFARDFRRVFQPPLDRGCPNLRYMFKRNVLNIYIAIEFFVDFVVLTSSLAKKTLKGNFVGGYFGKRKTSRK